jgi:NIMA (never in mitosis gene a)-related kinase
VRLLASLDSPYIIRYYEAFFDETIESLCMVMELAEEGDLRKKIDLTKSQKKMTPEIEIWKVMIHLLHGLRMLHDNRILHRDLKCENIMVSQSDYKIGDMNVSIINKRGLVDTQTGTPYYSSPEVWKDEPYN